MLCQICLRTTIPKFHFSMFTYCSTGLRKMLTVILKSANLFNIWVSLWQEGISSWLFKAKNEKNSFFLTLQYLWQVKQIFGPFWGNLFLFFKFSFGKLFFVKKNSNFKGSSDFLKIKTLLHMCWARLRPNLQICWHWTPKVYLIGDHFKNLKKSCVTLP